MKYFTFPIIEIDETLDIDLQQNVSDLIYAVFYASGSLFVKSFQAGNNAETLQNSLFLQIQNSINTFETTLGSKYVLDEVNVEDFILDGEKVSSRIIVKSGNLDLGTNIEITKGLI